MSLSWCWCSCCCCGSGSNQPGSRCHSDRHWSADAGSAVTSWATRTQRQSGAPSQTLTLLWSSWSWERQEGGTSGAERAGKLESCLMKGGAAWQLIPGREVSYVFCTEIHLETTNKPWETLNLKSILNGDILHFSWCVRHLQQVTFREAFLFLNKNKQNTGTDSLFWRAVMLLFPATGSGPDRKWLTHKGARKQDKGVGTVCLWKLHWKNEPDKHPKVCKYAKKKIKIYSTHCNPKPTVSGNTPWML